MPSCCTQVDTDCLSGAIEEKIYHRQIFKHFLSQRVLSDPRANMTLSSKQLNDLFTLDEPGMLRANGGCWTMHGHITHC